jgi:hypothetical protein
VREVCAGESDLDESDAESDAESGGGDGGEAWCASASRVFDAVATVAVLFHVRSAPMFLRAVRETVTEAAGQPFDEQTLRALQLVSPGQLLSRQEVAGEDGQVGLEEPRVILRFTEAPAPPAAGPWKRQRLEPSRAGGFGRAAAFAKPEPLGGLQELVACAKVEFRERCSAFVARRREEGRPLPPLHRGAVAAALPAVAGGAACPASWQAWTAGRCCHSARLALSHVFVQNLKITGLT